MITRANALRGKCPTCGALPGAPCLNTRGRPRVSLHLDRWEASRKRAARKLKKEP